MKEMMIYFLCIIGNNYIVRETGLDGNTTNWFIHGDSETQSHSIKDMCKQHNPFT